MTDMRDADGPRANGLRAAETIRQLLTRMELEPEELQRPGVIAFLTVLDGPANQGNAQVLLDAERFVFHFIFDGYVESSRRPAVAEFIARVNWGLIEGGFELNFENGAVRYKVGIDFSNAELTDQLVRNAILSAMTSIEPAAAALIDVARNGKAPAEAFRDVEAERRRS